MYILFLLCFLLFFNKELTRKVMIKRKAERGCSSVLKMKPMIMIIFPMMIFMTMSLSPAPSTSPGQEYLYLRTRSEALSPFRMKRVPSTRKLMENFSSRRHCDMTTVQSSMMVDYCITCRIPGKKILR